MKKFLRSFKFAARGIAEACRQRNFRFHVCAMIFVIVFGAMFYEFTSEKWAILLLTCAGALSLETVNTGLERLADKVTEEHSHRIRVAKDCAAGGVLIWAVFATSVGILLFWDLKRFAEIGRFFADPLRIALLVIAVAAAWAFVFVPEIVANKADKKKRSEDKDG